MRSFKYLGATPHPPSGRALPLKTGPKLSIGQDFFLKGASFHDTISTSGASTSTYIHTLTHTPRETLFIYIYIYIYIKI